MNYKYHPVRNHLFIFLDWLPGEISDILVIDLNLFPVFLHHLINY